MKYILSRDKVFEQEVKPRFIRVQHIQKYEELLVNGVLSRWMAKLLDESVQQSIDGVFDRIGGYRVEGTIHKEGDNKRLTIPITKIENEESNFMSDLYNDNELFEVLELQISVADFKTCLPLTGKGPFIEQYGAYSSDIIDDVEVVKYLNNKTENNAINLSLTGRYANSLDSISPMTVFIEICRELALDQMAKELPKFKPTIYRKIPDPEDLTKEEMDKHWQLAMDSDNVIDNNGDETNHGRCAIELLISEELTTGFNKALITQIESFYTDVLSTASAQEENNH